MNQYRISKYNPENRVGGVYTVNEWTSFSDIGKIYEGTKLSYEMYQKTERSYIRFCLKLMEWAHISDISIQQVEYYTDEIRFPLRAFDTNSVCQMITACLREQCWMKLIAKDFFIHFGYDYYIYIGTLLPFSIVSEIATEYGLFCEICQSPYN